jgi:hypothetical protein
MFIQDLSFIEKAIEIAANTKDSVVATEKAAEETLAAAKETVLGESME